MHFTWLEKAQEKAHVNYWLTKPTALFSKQAFMLLLSYTVTVPHRSPVELTIAEHPGPNNFMKRINPLYSGNTLHITDF